ncbi:FAD-dependent oxidoreductase [Planktothrix sp. FACHB-1365]|uniref:FAD-dependent oxidoreductase n=1 Tax=Planktothrix sp. FACHB-1365 TaxID=2692855 RepID=UPI0016870E3D|nr:FAD-dependent oxidoreductase [Planktothrix sp. FACHB-1365]MBD2484750.1 FAD-dependent oxidoreductase [Planktothrix sp. FACHB-1365]
MKKLVLIGGGHSHAIILKKWGINPLSEVELTLITNVVKTPYSGMLPGYIAGFYTFDQCHINLPSLAQFCQAKIYIDQAINLDLEKNLVICENHSPIPFDLVSIDIGSTPATLTIPGAREQTIAVKPISQFLQYWQQLVDEIQQNPEQKIRLAIVGGGAGGVELALNIHSHLTQIYQQANQPLNQLELHLIHQGERLLSERHPSLSQKVETILKNRNIYLHLNQTVDQVEATQNLIKRIRCKSGLTLDCDRIFWVTQASASPWLKQTGLTTDKRGFILVNDNLQSISHPQVFATGDIATMVNYPRPKAGVFAVRQGQPLLENLKRSLQEKPLKPFIPQQEFLILIGTGDRKALASKGWFNMGPNSLFWRWKDYLDQKFMRQFRL